MQSRSRSLSASRSRHEFRLSDSPGIKSIRFYELHIQFIVGNRRDLAIDKRAGEIRTRDTGIPIHFRYRWMEVGINGGVTKSYTWIAIVRAWKARDKCRRRIIDTITFTYRYKLYPVHVRTSFTTHCYPPYSAAQTAASLISLVRELARQVVEATKFSTINFIGVTSPCYSIVFRIRDPLRDRCVIVGAA